MKARTGERKGRGLRPPLVEIVAGGKASFEVSSNINVMEH